MQLRLAAVSAWPMRQHQSQLKRRLLVSVPADATVQRVPKLGARGTPTTLASAKPKQQVDIWTAAAPTTLKAQRGDDLALSASLVSLVGAVDSVPRGCIPPSTGSSDERGRQCGRGSSPPRRSPSRPCAGAGIAYATIPGAGAVYTACMLKNVGTVRLIDPSLPAVESA